jgi:hypothetical protein
MSGLDFTSKPDLDLLHARMTSAIELIDRVLGRPDLSAFLRMLDREAMSEITVTFERFEAQISRFLAETEGLPERIAREREFAQGAMLKVDTLKAAITGRAGPGN